MSCHRTLTEASLKDIQVNDNTQYAPTHPISPDSGEFFLGLIDLDLLALAFCRKHHLRLAEPPSGHYQAESNQNRPKRC